jgi:acyl-CoA thioester hydrolase
MDDEGDVTLLLAEYPVSIAIPVQWSDQDPFGHVNNVVYFRWFESGRIAYLQRIGLTKHLTGEPIGPILAAASCDYRRAIVFPDTVRVGVRATRIGRTSIGLEHRIVSVRQRALAAEGTSTIVVYDYSVQRPHPVSEEVRNAVEELQRRSP